jgi:hypothetical protein
LGDRLRLVASRNSAIADAKAYLTIAFRRSACVQTLLSIVAQRVAKDAEKLLGSILLYAASWQS